MSRSVVGDAECHAPSILTLYGRLEEAHRKSSALSQELALAHEVVSQALVGSQIVPAIPAWKRFIENLIQYPLPRIRIENGKAKPDFWIAKLDGNWVLDILDQADLKRRVEFARELPYRLDPGLRAREEANLRYATDRDQRVAEWNAMSLEERAARNGLSGGEILMMSRLSRVTRL
jgi:hypothetical protein